MSIETVLKDGKRAYEIEAKESFFLFHPLTFENFPATSPPEKPPNFHISKY